MCLAQSAADAERYAQLGAPRVMMTGNLKLDVPAPPVDQAALKRLKEIIGTRPVVAAASTHPGEEASIVAAHGLLRAKFPTLLTVIVPRHPARGEGIAEIAKAAGLPGALRSQRAQPMPDVAIYIADTLGELGLIYRVAPIVFMGGSLASHGGQNPIEAVRLGAAVLHGPHVWNFAEIYATLDAAHGAELVADEAALTARLGELARRCGSAQDGRRRRRRHGWPAWRRAQAHAGRARSLSDATSVGTAGGVITFIAIMRISVGA